MTLVGQGVGGGCSLWGKGTGESSVETIPKPTISVVELWAVWSYTRHLEPRGVHITAACVSECHHPLQW